MDEVDRIVTISIATLGGIMFVSGGVRAWRRGTKGLVKRHADGSALTFEEQRALRQGMWRATIDPAHRLDLVLIIAGLLIGSGFLSPVWRGIRALMG